MLYEVLRTGFQIRDARSAISRSRSCIRQPAVVTRAELALPMSLNASSRYSISG